MTTGLGRYAPGDVIRLHLANPTDRDYWFNVCMDPLERWEGSGWVTVTQDRACTAIAHDLRARTTAPAPYALERDVADGEYRIAVRLAASVVVRSNAFHIDR